VDKMADDSELDYIDTFLTAIHTGYTVETIETTRNINMIADTQAVLVYTGEALNNNGIIINKQYKLQYKDTSEGNLNSAIYGLIEGIRKLNARETIAGYTKDTSIVGMEFVGTGLDYYHVGANTWYANVKIIVRWLTV
jgi:hypothetical protein